MIRTCSGKRTDRLAEFHICDAYGSIQIKLSLPQYTGLADCLCLESHYSNKTLKRRAIALQFIRRLHDFCRRNGPMSRKDLQVISKLKLSSSSKPIPYVVYVADGL